MPDVPPVPDEVAALRAANARLRLVVEAKDTEITALRTSHQAQLDALRAQVAALSAEVAELRARLGQNSAEFVEAAVAGGAGQAGAEVAAGQVRAQAGTAEGAARRDPGDDRSSR